MKKENWVIVPGDSHISFEIPCGNHDPIQGFCGNLMGNIESRPHEFENAKLLLEIPTKYLSVSDSYLSSMLGPIKTNAHNTHLLLRVEGVISETNFDEVYTFHGTLSSADCKKHFSMFVTGGNETDVSGNMAESYFEFTGQLDTTGLWPKDVASIIAWKDLTMLVIIRGRIKIERLCNNENKKTINHKFNSV